MRHARERKRASASSGALPQFEVVGDLVLVTRVRKNGVLPRLVSTWTGLWRVGFAAGQHVYDGMENIVTGKGRRCTLPGGARKRTLR